MLWLDCSARTEQRHELSVESWAGGALGRTWWTSKRGERRDALALHDDARLLWEEVEQFCHPGKRAVLWGHDLAWQLRISQALVHLPDLGWHLDRIVLERTAAWATLRKGKRTLMCCDLKSWAPVGLEKIASDLASIGLGTAADLGLSSLPLSAPLLNAVIVREAVLQILGWVKREELGPFRPTGSGQSYAGYRRRFLSHKLLVHDDFGRLEAERTAMWTGRCEAWRHGHLPDGPYVEYDMAAAYATIASEAEVPAIAGRQMSRPTLDRLQSAMGEGAVLAEVEIETDVPIVPTWLGERTCWPVGRFNTVLWDPELHLALEYAKSVKVERAWRYTRAPALQDFSRWVLEGMITEKIDGNPIAARVLKHWSRCLVGRLGLRYRQWQHFGENPGGDLQLVTWIDLDEGTSTDLLCAGKDRLILTGLVEALDSLPQIPGWVMSECRRRLWEAMTWSDLDRLVYVDTDSMILQSRLGLDVSPHSGWTPGPGWAIKGHYRDLTIHGPRNLVLHDARRVSGLPLTARQTAPLEFSGEVMRSIKESMKSGRLDHVAHIPRRFVLDAPDLRRQHLPGGSTIPYTLEPTGG